MTPDLEKTAREVLELDKIARRVLELNNGRSARREKMSPNLVLDDIVITDEMFKAASIPVARAYLKQKRIVGVLEKALEEFRLGHKHEPGLAHTRALGDGYGWCDFCQTKVSWGPGDAEIALAEARRIEGEE